MSGLFGIIDRSQSERTEFSLKKMGEILSHRPWFSTNYFVDHHNGVYLGRIGIGIFNNVNDTCNSEDGDITVLLTGEYYNSGTIKNEIQKKGTLLGGDSDAELVLRVYQNFGLEVISRFHGIFVVAIYDRKLKKFS